MDGSGVEFEAPAAVSAAPAAASASAASASGSAAIKTTITGRPISGAICRLAMLVRRLVNQSRA
jgi:hypothetical protein